MKEIPLTKGKVALVDDEDYEELSKHKWYYTRSGYAARDTRNNARTSGNCIYMHKYIVPSNEKVDHINRNKLDNRKENLRHATNALNLSNRPKQVNNNSGYKGVSWSKVANKWTAEIQAQKVRYRLGYFEDKSDAARMYNFWCVFLHGEFALLNEVNGSKIEIVDIG
ncbi:HNH endonuclease [Bacillus sp. PK3-056]|uniref:HNH endonuclease n=1 Tax=Niallia circulans TaxID=1397 RepID=UPI000F44F500|nr:HNH endonuclease [Niallia circulans]AYV74294.1 Fis family transcriptional regulator [Niallia circulans]